MRRHNRGFSLIELLIVVSIILIIAAIAIPNLLRSRMAANQASAVESLRVVHSAQVAYYSSYGVGFAISLAQLGPPSSGTAVSASAAGMIDNVLASGMKSGYTFPLATNSPDINGYYQGYTVNANPITPGTSGTTYYFSDQTYVIGANSAAPASASDSPLAQ